MHWLVLLLLALCAYYFVRYWFQLYLNYRIVRKTGLPYLISPVNTVSAPWIILGPLLRGPMERYLPSWLWEPLSYTIYGWEFRTGWAPHAKNGPVFMMATANHPEMFIADPDVVHDILRRPREFPLSDVGHMIMGKFGDNLIIAKFKAWERMRRFIAPLINERVSSTVFQETKAQTEQLAEHLDSVGGVTDDSAENLKKIAINVLGAAGYGKSRTWSAGAEYDNDKPPAGFHVTYLQAMRYLMDNMLAMAFVPIQILDTPFMGQSLNVTAHAIRELPALTRKLLDEERNTTKIGGRANIAQLLVQEQHAAEKGAITLHEDEIVGNLFVFSAAGTDTTANSMAYALFILAAYPKWQDWIIEEIDEVLAGKGQQLEYNDIHPKLIRTIALMYETLRLYTPLTHIARHAHEPLSIPYQGKEVIVPADTIIYINSYALHSNPTDWSDVAPPTTFHPPRFLTTSPDAPGRPCIRPLRKGSYVPWSAGPRVCPGQKMSQVEFCTVFMTIFRKHRVEVALEEGETPEMGQQRVQKTMKDSFPRLTMQMNRPKQVQLRFVKR